MTYSPRCALYLRVSLDATGEELGVTRQAEDGRKLIEARGWTLQETYVDNDTSAAGKVQRPAFEAMLAGHRAGLFSIIVSRDMDRLTRNRPDRLRILEIGEQSGMLLAFWRGTDLDLSTPAGRLTAEILASVARHEIEQMSDRRRRANVQRAEMGLPGGGRRPFGYCQHVGPERLCSEGCAGSMRSVVQAEASALREVAELVISGPGLWAATARLNELGHRTTAGGPWHHSELRRLLLNQRYAGRRMHRGVDVGPAQWPAIFDEDTAAALRAVLTDPGRRRSGAPTRHLLSGLATCGADGCGMVVHGSPSSSGYAVYTCASRRHVAIRSEQVDAYVVEALAARLGQPDALVHFGTPSRPGGLALLRARESALTARASALAEAFAAGDIDRAQLRAGSERIRAELVEVRSEMSAAVASPVLAHLVGADDAAALVRRWADADRAQFRAVLAVMVRVVLHSPGRGARRFRPESVELRWEQ